MSRDIKYIGMDVHKGAVVIAVLNSSGKLVMESIVETKASSILQFIHGLRGELHVTWEEGTWAAWLYDLLQPQVAQVLVCDPRRNALLKEGNKSDKIDADHTMVRPTQCLRSHSRVSTGTSTRCGSREALKCLSNPYIVSWTKLDASGLIVL
jgi:hypothetical protein